MSDVRLGVKIEVETDELNELNKIFAQLQQMQTQLNTVQATTTSGLARQGEAVKEVTANIEGLTSSIKEYGQLVSVNIAGSNKQATQTYVDLDGAIRKVTLTKSDSGEITQKLTSVVYNEAQAMKVAARQYEDYGNIVERIGNKIMQSFGKLNSGFNLKNIESELLVKPVMPRDALGKQVEVERASVERLNETYLQVSQTLRNMDGVMTRATYRINQQTGDVMELSSQLSYAADNMARVAKEQEKWTSMPNFDPLKNAAIGRTATDVPINANTLKIVSVEQLSNGLKKVVQQLEDVRGGITKVELTWDEANKQMLVGAVKTTSAIEKVKKIFDETWHSLGKIQDFDFNKSVLGSSPLGTEIVDVAEVHKVQELNSEWVKFVQVVKDAAGNLYEVNVAHNKATNEVMLGTTKSIEAMRKLNQETEKWVDSYTKIGFDARKDPVVNQSLFGTKIKGVQGLSNVYDKDGWTYATQQLVDYENALISIPIKFNQMTGEVLMGGQKMNMQIQDLKSSTLSFGAALKVALERITQWGIATTVIYGTLRVMRESLQTMGEIEQAAIGVKRVLPTDTDFAGLEHGAIVLGVNFGKSVVETYQSMQSWARQYKDVNDIILMTNASMMAAAATDIELADSVKNLSAIMAEFELKTTQAMHVVDVFNEISNSFRATATDVAEGLSKMGAAAYQLGMGLEMGASLVATGVESLGASGAEIGTALKTAFARITEASTISELKSMGIEVKNLEQVIFDMGLAWDTWSIAEQTAIAKSIGGTHHFTKIMGIMANFDRVIQGMAIAYDSQGSAQEEAARSLDSLKTRIGQASAAWDRFVMSNKALFDIINTLITGFGTIINALAQFNEAAGGIPVILGLAVTAVKLITMSMKTMATVATASAAETTAAMAEVAASTATAAATTGAFTGTIGKLAAGATALLGKVGLIIAILGAVTFAIGVLARKNDDLAISIDGVNKEIQKMQNIRQEITSLSEMADLYDKVSNKLKTMSENTDQYNKLKKTQEIIETRLFGALRGNSKFYDDEKVGVENLSDSIRELVKQKEEDILATQKQAMASYNLTRQMLEDRKLFYQSQLEKVALGAVIEPDKNENLIQRLLLFFKQFAAKSAYGAEGAAETIGRILKDMIDEIDQQIADLPVPEIGFDVISERMIDWGAIESDANSTAFRFVDYSEEMLNKIVTEAKRVSGILKGLGVELTNDIIRLVIPENNNFLYREVDVDSTVFGYVEQLLTKGADKLSFQFIDVTDKTMEVIKQKTKELQDLLIKQGVAIDPQTFDVVMGENVVRMTFDPAVFGRVQQQVTSLENLKEKIDKLGLRQAVEDELRRTFSIDPEKAAADTWQKALDNIEELRDSFKDAYDEAMKVPEDVLESWDKLYNKIAEIDKGVTQQKLALVEKYSSLVLNPRGYDKLAERGLIEGSIDIYTKAIEDLFNLVAEFQTEFYATGTFSATNIAKITGELTSARNVLAEQISGKGLAEEEEKLAEMDETISRLKDGTINFGDVLRAVRLVIVNYDDSLVDLNSSLGRIAKSHDALIDSFEKGEQALKGYLDTMKEFGGYWDNLAQEDKMKSMFKSVYDSNVTNQLRQYGQTQVDILREQANQEDKILSDLENRLNNYQNEVFNVYQEIGAYLPQMITTLADTAAYMVTNDKGIPLFGEDGIIKFNDSFYELFNTKSEGDKLAKAVSDWYNSVMKDVEFDPDADLLTQFFEKAFGQNPEVLNLLKDINSQILKVNDARSKAHDAEQAEIAYKEALELGNKALKDREQALKNLTDQLRQVRVASLDYLYGDIYDDPSSGIQDLLFLGDTVASQLGIFGEGGLSKAQAQVKQGESLIKQWQTIAVEIYRMFSYNPLMNQFDDAKEAAEQINNLLTEPFGENQMSITDLIGEPSAQELREVLNKLYTEIDAEIKQKDIWNSSTDSDETVKKVNDIILQRFKDVGVFDLLMNSYITDTTRKLRSDREDLAELEAQAALYEESMKRLADAIAQVNRLSEENIKITREALLASGEIVEFKWETPETKRPFEVLVDGFRMANEELEKLNNQYVEMKQQEQDWITVLGELQGADTATLTSQFRKLYGQGDGKESPDKVFAQLAEALGISEEKLREFAYRFVNLNSVMSEQQTIIQSLIAALDMLAPYQEPLEEAYQKAVSEGNKALTERKSLIEGLVQSTKELEARAISFYISQQSKDNSVHTINSLLGVRPFDVDPMGAIDKQRAAVEENKKILQEWEKISLDFYNAFAVGILNPFEELQDAATVIEDMLNQPFGDLQIPITDLLAGPEVEKLRQLLTELYSEMGVMANSEDFNNLGPMAKQDVIMASMKKYFADRNMMTIFPVSWLNMLIEMFPQAKDELEGLIKRGEAYEESWGRIVSFVEAINKLSKETADITRESLLASGEIISFDWEMPSVKDDITQAVEYANKAEEELEKFNDKYIDMRKKQQEWLDELSKVTGIDTELLQKEWDYLFGPEGGKEDPTEKIKEYADALNLAQEEVAEFARNLGSMGVEIREQADIVQSLINEALRLGDLKILADEFAESLKGITSELKTLNSESEKLYDTIMKQYETVVRNKFQPESANDYAQRKANEMLTLNYGGADATYSMPSFSDALRIAQIQVAILDKIKTQYQQKAQELNNLTDDFIKTAEEARNAELYAMEAGVKLIELKGEQEQYLAMLNSINQTISEKGESEAIIKQLEEAQNGYDYATTAILGLEDAMEKANITYNVASGRLEIISEQHHQLAMEMGGLAAAYISLEKEEERRIRRMEYQKELGDIWLGFISNVTSSLASADMLGSLTNQVDAFGNVMKDANGQVIQFYDSMQSVERIGDSIQNAFAKLVSDSFGKAFELDVFESSDFIKAWADSVGWEQIEEEWGKALTGVFKFLADKGAELAPFLGSMITSWWGIIFNIFSTDNWRESLDALGDGIVNGFQNILDTVVRIIEHLPKLFMEIVETIIEMIPRLVWSIIKAIASAFKSLPSILNGVLLGMAMKALWEQFGKYILDGFNWVKEGISKIMGSLVDTVVTWLAKTIPFLNNWVNTFISGISEALQWMWAVNPMLGIGGALGVGFIAYKIGSGIWNMLSGKNKTPSSSNAGSSGNTSYTAGSNVPITYNNYITLQTSAFMGDEDDARQFSMLIAKYIEAEESRSA